MSNVNALLTQRLKKTDHSSKMAAMARQSANGNLTSFSGIFSVHELSDREKTFLEEILRDHSDEDANVEADLRSLISITSEVKAINNQAAILHGERIKKAQQILTPYRDGAFTSWLIATYGNRQTPYNFLQYYEFHEALPKLLRAQLELMPRQAVYTLASRDGPLIKKQNIVEQYSGQSKSELLIIIREAFPLDEKDRRRENLGDSVIQSLNKIRQLMARQKASINKTQRQTIQELIEELQELIAK